MTTCHLNGSTLTCSHLKLVVTHLVLSGGSDTGLIALGIGLGGVIFADLLSRLRARRKALEDALRLLHEAVNHYEECPRGSNQAVVALLQVNARLLHLRRRARWLRNGRPLRTELAATMVELDEAMRKNQVPRRDQLLGADIFDNLVYYWRPDRTLRQAINAKRQEDGAALLGKPKKP